jgi:hypothetical protein
MFKVIIKKASDLSHIGWRTFDTAEIANAWLDEVSPSGAWGKPAYTEIIPAVIDDEGNELEPEQTIEHAAEFTVEIVDITEQIEDEKGIQKNLARMAFGQRLMAELAMQNQKDIALNLLTVDDVIRTESELRDVQRLISNGSLPLALGLLQTLPLIHMTQEKKAYFIGKITQYLSTEV